MNPMVGDYKDDQRCNSTEMAFQTRKISTTARSEKVLSLEKIISWCTDSASDSMTFIKFNKKLVIRIVIEFIVLVTVFSFTLNHYLHAKVFSYVVSSCTNCPNSFGSCTQINVLGAQTSVGGELFNVKVLRKDSLAANYSYLQISAAFNNVCQISDPLPFIKTLAVKSLYFNLTSSSDSTDTFFSDNANPEIKYFMKLSNFVVFESNLMFLISIYRPK